MIYLLDVNVLVAMKYLTHAHHARAIYWLDDLRRRKRRHGGKVDRRRPR